MDLVTNLYASQPFWLWMALGVALLATEAAFSTEWLLWPAVAAGVVAVLTLFGLRIGLGGELVLFGVLTVLATLASRRLIKRVSPDDEPDINSRDARLVGLKAVVIQPFVDGRGRVFVSGAEWAADLEGASAPDGASVVVSSVEGARLRVRPA
ncbi:nodulation protein NfeD [Brevundimonas sp. Leaf363]|uniref:NfeD family protein n=1 Tax=Brevundimonas sp. Leaf363 TaxID=1736353 RepID=UPI0006F6D5A5|nr:NfeD family protein [Brevundimonas sp. Leaf363]KQS56633.1 nodulation protein NfeD [Brevundimonas sp. Leaf363]